MLIGAKGEQIGVLPVEEALDHATNAEMDLVEVAPNADPPVCKIMDYGKYKYRQNKKAHDAKKRQKIIKIKEVKITPKTEEHDYQFKLSHVKRFLADGGKVKISVFFRGRQIAHSELGLKILERFVADLEDFAVVEQEPKREGRSMILVVIPKPVDTKNEKNENQG